MVVTDKDGRMLFCNPTKLGSCVDIANARELRLAKLLDDGPAAESLADAVYRGRVRRRADGW